jgi:hypothetical protein
MTDAGIRRVSWVRITFRDGHCHATAIGLGHRLPIETPISLARAASLAEAGVRVVMRGREF